MSEFKIKIRKPKLSIIINKHGNAVIYFGKELVDVANIRNMDDIEEKVRAVRSSISGAGLSYNKKVESLIREKLS